MTHHPPAGVGAKLRKARERRGISVQQIAASTKISLSVLQALERDDISRVPGGVFGRAYLRSFATAVGLDPEAIVEEFVAQFPLVSVTEGYPPTEQVDETKSPETRPSETSIKINPWEPSRVLRLGAVALLPAAALMVYVGTPRRWPQWAAVQSRVVTTQARSTDNTAGEHVSGSNPVPTTNAEQRPEQPQPSSAKTDGNSVAAPSIAAPLPARGQSAQGTGSKVLTADPARSPSPTAPASPAPTRGVDRLTVVLTVTQPSWVIATVDGVKILNRLMEVGDQETFEARRDLVLTAGDGGAIVMTLNGNPAKSLGATGKTITTRIDLTNFSDFVSHDPPGGSR